MKRLIIQGGKIPGDPYASRQRKGRVSCKVLSGGEKKTGSRSLGGGGRNVMKGRGREYSQKTGRKNWSSGSAFHCCSENGVGSPPERRGNEKTYNPLLGYKRGRRQSAIFVKHKGK